jgi:hypothetical protein
MNQGVERYLMTSLAALLAGSIGAFLLLVPAMALITVTLLIAGLVLTFVLGVYVGGRAALNRERIAGSEPSTR